MKSEPSKVLLRELPEQELKRLDRMLGKEGEKIPEKPEQLASQLRRRASYLSRMFKK